MDDTSRDTVSAQIERQGPHSNKQCCTVLITLISLGGSHQAIPICPRRLLIFAVC